MAPTTFEQFSNLEHFFFFLHPFPLPRVLFSFPCCYLLAFLFFYFFFPLLLFILGWTRIIHYGLIDIKLKPNYEEIQVTHGQSHRQITNEITTNPLLYCRLCILCKEVDK